MVSKRNEAVPRYRGGERRRTGLTLTELLVVIAILVVVTSVLAPLVAPSLDGREVREAARQVNAYFQQAQQKAKQLGRPVGVVINRSPNPPVTDEDGNVTQDFAYQLSLAEEPPPFRGFTDNDRVRFIIGSNGRIATNEVNAAINDNRSAAFAYVHLDAPPSGPADLGFVKTVQPNDLIQFNMRGPKYPILSVERNQNTSFPNANFQVRFLIDDLPFARFALGSVVKFEVYRRPRMTSSTPLELPAGTAIAMNLSGVGMDYLSGTGVESQVSLGLATPRQKYIGLTEFQRLSENEFPSGSVAPAVLDELAKLPLTIMFSPDGSIDRVYRVLPPFNVIAAANIDMSLLPPKRPQDKIFLFLGRDATNTIDNFNDGKSIWIAIDPQTGSVTTAPHLLDPSIDPLSQPLRAIANARQTAATGQSMGGQ